MMRAIALVEASDDGSSRAADSAELLETKLFLPGFHSRQISRPRLASRIADGVQGRLTLISAPAGFGKTTLVADWLSASSAAGQTGWFSIDQGDNDPVLFWRYVIRALQNVEPDVGRRALWQLQSSPPPQIESVLRALINDLSDEGPHLVLVLDDYHLIETDAIHAALAFLLDHLPPRLHLVIASRSDPPLPLARLRARGELTEIRPFDLRFSLEESSDFLNRVMNLGFSPARVETLERRTEGWITGLKLAALSLKGRENDGASVEAFSGEDRFIADYLVEEVLRAQPERIRRFLLATSGLDRLCGHLCDAVTGEDGSQAVLETLDRQNLFLVPLDNRREWYRYHHLFAEVLQARLRTEDEGAAADLHRRASLWYGEHGLPSEAISHALAAGDSGLAAASLELDRPPMDKSYRSRTWLERVKQLPIEAVRARPLLTMWYGWGLLNSGEIETAESRLDEVQGWLERAENPDDELARTLSRELAAARVYLAQTAGQGIGTVEQARRSRELLPEDDLFGRATGTALLALAHWAEGELEAAYETFSDALVKMRLAGEPLSAIRGTFVPGDLRVAQGRLRDAVVIYESGLKIAAELPDPSVAETDELHLGLAEIYCERGDVDAALRHLRIVEEAAGAKEHLGNRWRWCAAMARAKQLCGENDAAMALLDEAERTVFRDPLPRARPIAAIRARYQLAAGDLSAAERWAADRGPVPDERLTYLREYDHLTLVRVLLARARSVDGRQELLRAQELLTRLAGAATEGGRGGSTIEILILQAIVHDRLGEHPAAAAALDGALTLAEPEGYFQLFADEAVGLRPVLGEAAGKGNGYARRLLSAIDAGSAQRAADSGRGASSDGPLTARELDILRLLASGRRNQEIAKQLFISPATVKRHVANIYLKLEVNHRTEALLKASTLHLL